MKTNFQDMSDDEIQKWVIKSLEGTKELSSEQRAEKVREIIENLDKELDPAFLEFIMQTRGHGCYDKHKKGMLGEVPDSVKNITDFIEYLDRRWASFPDGITEGLKRDGNVLTARIFKCPCVFVNASKEPVPKSYCNCSAGFYQSIFKEFLGKPVKAEVITSIASGGDKCEIKITLPPDVFET